MQIILYATGILTLASLLIAVLAYGVLRLLRRKPARYARGTLLVHTLLVPLYGLVIVPFALAWFGVRNAHTRSDEASYSGPRLRADGTWELQSRASLAREAVDGAAEATRSPYAVDFVAEDGIRLHGYHVPAPGEARTPSVIVAHGLFRGALEIEPVAAMFRELGAAVLLLELRSHGKSQRAPLGFGAHEARDVKAAADYLRSRRGQTDAALVLYGVSLGAAAVLLAAPTIQRVAAICVEAPMDAGWATGDRMLNLPPKPGHRRLTIPQPFRLMILTGAEFWSALDLDAVRPVDAVAHLDNDLPVLVIGGGDDLRMPPAVVRAVFDALPMPEPTKQLWIRDGSDHGAVFVDDPQQYRAKLAELLARAR